MPTPGPLELVIILVIALLILGPGKLPDVGSALGKSIREFRKASSDLGDSVKVDTSPLPPTPQDARDARGRRLRPPRPPARPRRRPHDRRAARRARASRHDRVGRDAPQRADDRHELGPGATRPRWPTPTPCATPRLPGVPATPGPTTATRDRARWLGHVPRRSPRGAARPPVPRDPRGRRRCRRRLLLRRADPQHAPRPHPGRHGADPRTGRRLRDHAADRARSPASSSRCR